MKKTYISPAIEVVEFDSEALMTLGLSGGDGSSARNTALSNRRDMDDWTEDDECEE